MSLPRLWHAATALLALAGLGIEYKVTIDGHPGRLAERTLIYLSFFTILTNALVMAASFGLAQRKGALHRWARRPTTRTAVSVYITVVAVIFQLLLAKLVHLTPLGWWGNLLVHQLVPALWLGGWVLFHPHGGIGRTAHWRWLIYPLAYGGWTIAHGAMTGWYPYPFINVAKLGAARVAHNMALMALFFAGLGLAFRWMDETLATHLPRHRARG
jgi:hypothetical protein